MTDQPPRSKILDKLRREESPSLKRLRRIRLIIILGGVVAAIIVGWWGYEAAGDRARTSLARRVLSAIHERMLATGLPAQADGAYDPVYQWPEGLRTGQTLQHFALLLGLDLTKQPLSDDIPADAFMLIRLNHTGYTVQFIGRYTDPPTILWLREDGTIEVRDPDQPEPALPQTLP